MIFFPRSKCRNRSARAPAGSRCTCWPKTPKVGLLGAVPCYVKSHSRGEYVFDHGWAEAYERAGGSYYPKLQVSVPFTPATGRRLLARPGPQAEAVRGGARRRAGRHLPALGRVLGPRHLPDRAGMGAAGRARLPQAHPSAVPLGECRLRELRRVPGRARLAQAQRPSAANARTRSRPASACTG